MARLPLLCFFSLILLCGCTPKDPLDRKVKAATPEKFAHWWDRTQEKFPDEQRAEVYKLARYLQDSIPRTGSMQANDHNDPLCKRINGLTVRQLMILAYEESSYTTRNRIIIETGKLPRLVTIVSESDSDEARNYAERMLDHTRQQIARWNETLASNDRRIAELTAPAATP